MVLCGCANGGETAVAAGSCGRTNGSDAGRFCTGMRWITPSAPTTLAEPVECSASAVCMSGCVISCDSVDEAARDLAGASDTGPQVGSGRNADGVAGAMGNVGKLLSIATGMSVLDGAMGALAIAWTTGGMGACGERPVGWFLDG